MIPIMVDRKSSIQVFQINTNVKIAEYSNLPVGKYIVKCRSQVLISDEPSIVGWLMITTSNTSPETGFDYGMSYPSHTAQPCVYLDQPIQISSESESIEIYVYFYPRTELINLKVWIYKIG